MKKQTKTILLLAGLAVLLVAATLVYRNLSGAVAPEVLPDTPQNAQQSAEEDRELALDFTVVDAQGNAVKLSDLRGKPVVLNFWASWCPPCKGEMPDFEKVYAELGEEVHFMMVDLVDGQRETQEKGAAYIQEQGFTFPVYYDTEQEAAYLYGVRSIPTSVFLDAEGYIVTAAEGALSESMLRKGIDAIVSAE